MGLRNLVALAAVAGALTLASCSTGRAHATVRTPPRAVATSTTTTTDPLASAASELQQARTDLTSSDVTRTSVEGAPSP